MKKRFEERVNICFKPNDIRCVADLELDSEICYKTGKALSEFLKVKYIIVGADMRLSSKTLKKALIEGILDSGVNVIDIGLIDTPGLYFASGYMNKCAAMITASHNPAKYNGIKMTLKGAVPLNENNGLLEIRQKVLINEFKKFNIKGKIIKKNILKDYKKHIRSFIKSKNLDVKIVVDAGNGMAGKLVPLVYTGLIREIYKLDFKLDGRFPNHEANPAKLKNIKDLREKVIETKADFGIAFDGDVDRVFFVDEQGRAIDSSLIACLLIKYFGKNKFVYNSVMSKIVPETIRNFGGKGYLEKVGHTFMKSRMKKVNAIFGCENSAHYYYKDNYYADSGLITSLIVCEIYNLAKKKGLKFSDLIKEFDKYYKINEKSFKVENKKEVTSKIEKYYSSGKISKLDGLTVYFNDWWFNLRASNTEPLLRLNLEADSKKLERLKLKGIVNLIKKFS